MVLRLLRGNLWSWAPGKRQCLQNLSGPTPTSVHHNVKRSTSAIHHNPATGLTVNQNHNAADIWIRSINQFFVFFLLFSNPVDSVWSLLTVASRRRVTSHLFCVDLRVFLKLWSPARRGEFWLAWRQAVTVCARVPGPTIFWFIASPCLMALVWTWCAALHSQTFWWESCLLCYSVLAALVYVRTATRGDGHTWLWFVVCLKGADTWTDAQNTRWGIIVSIPAILPRVCVCVFDFEIGSQGLPSSP